LLKEIKTNHQSSLLTELKKLTEYKDRYNCSSNFEKNEVLLNNKRLIEDVLEEGHFKSFLTYTEEVKTNQSQGSSSFISEVQSIERKFTSFKQELTSLKEEYQL
jgi:hypothetical protein